LQRPRDRFCAWFISGIIAASISGLSSPTPRRVPSRPSAAVTRIEQPRQIPEVAFGKITRTTGRAAWDARHRGCPALHDVEEAPVVGGLRSTGTEGLQLRCSSLLAPNPTGANADVCVPSPCSTISSIASRAVSGR
jgi:hypothetical protein